MLCTQVLGAEFGNALLYGQVHQLTVNTYAVQHAGGRHPDKSVAIHLCGLHLVLDRGFRPPRVPPLHKRLADTVKTWPHFTPPADPGPSPVATRFTVARLLYRREASWVELRNCVPQPPVFRLNRLQPR